MRRFAVLIAAVGSLVAIHAGAAVAAGCPNEGFRVGPSAQLPECRAYEMVSPVDKNGGNVGRVLQVKVSPSGDAATFYSAAAFAGSPSSALSTGYVTQRGGSDWATQSLDPPQKSTGNSLLMSTVASTEDLGFSLSASDRAIAPGAIDGWSNLYLRNNATGATTLAYKTPGTRLFDQATGLSGGLFLGASADWSHILIRSNTPLTSDSAPESEENLYDLSGGELHLLNYRPDGSVETAFSTHTLESYRPYAYPMSADGRRVFLQFGYNGEGGVVMREDDQRSVWISVDQETGEPKPGNVLFANRAGTQVYFTSFDALIPGAPSNSIYRYDVATGSLTNLTPTAEGGNVRTENVLGASPDGSNVYFLASGALGDGATPAGFLESNLYALHDGELRFVGRTGNILPAWQTSPDGRYLGFASFADLTGEKVPSVNCPHLEAEYENAPGECMDIYVYDSQADTLSCATCDAGPTRHHAMLGGQEAREPSIQQGTEFARAMLDDGTVFFETASKLVPRDMNGVMDAYSWRAGATSLVSTGTDPNPSWFATATPDGRNALFLTNQSLVGSDTDNNIDLYDARVDGGLASQWPPGSPPPCQGEGCKSAAPTAPARLPAGSVTDAGAACGEATARAKRLQANGRRLTRKARVARRGKSKASRHRAARLGRKAAAERRAAATAWKYVKSCGGNG